MQLLVAGDYWDSTIIFFSSWFYFLFFREFAEIFVHKVSLSVANPRKVKNSPWLNPFIKNKISNKYRVVLISHG
jgi:hypothetical protein